MAAETQVQPSPGFDQARCQVHQLLDDRPDPPPFGRMPDRGLVAEQAQLPDKAQDVVGERGAAHHQGIDFELARGQSLQVHVGLEFAVELLAGAVVLVEGDDLLGRQAQGGPPAFQLDVGLQQMLPLLVDGALGDLDDPAADNFPLFADLVRPAMGVAHAHERDALARSGLADLAFGEGTLVPEGFAVAPGIPFEDVVNPLMGGQLNATLPGIVSGIEAHQHGSGGQFLRLAQHPVKKRNEVLLAVLGTFAHLDLQQPPLQGQIGGDRGKAVKSLVGARDLFLLRAGVVHREHVDIQRDVTGGQGRNQCPRLAQKLGGAKVHDGSKSFGVFLQALTQGRFGGNVFQPKGFTKEAVLAKTLDRRKVTLAQAEQPDVATHDIGMGDGPLLQLGNCTKALGQAGKAVQV